MPLYQDKGGTGRMVLVVDDELDHIELTTAHLVRAGYHVASAKSGREAIRMLQEVAFDAVVTDLNMPDGNGTDLLQWIRCEPQQSPLVIVLTAEADTSASDERFRGAYALLRKPLVAKTLVSSLETGFHASGRWQRKHERKGVMLAVDVSINNDDRPIKGLAVNIGAGGAFLHLGKEMLPQVGSELVFHLRLANGTSLAIKGGAIVRWRRTGPDGHQPAGIGIEFINLPLEHQQAMTALIASLAAQ